MTSIVKCFLDVSMSLSHDGLAEIARRSRIDVRTLETGQFVAFVNKQKNRVKLFAAGNIFAYMKLDRGQTVTMDTIRRIPRCFTAAAPEISIPKDVQAKLTKEFTISARRDRTYAEARAI